MKCRTRRKRLTRTQPLGAPQLQEAGGVARVRKGCPGRAAEEVVQGRAGNAARTHEMP
eukprot:COSAG02_NODE_47057_length_344_cov_0.595918_1_plen_58_part_00